ncbi:MAG: hypothetical protein JF617_06340 [Burkholderiales bacterium]|nr:hypothetical protein [Burkholderiales bacterium]
MHRKAADAQRQGNSKHEVEARPQAGAHRTGIHEISVPKAGEAVVKNGDRKFARTTAMAWQKTAAARWRAG